MKKNVAIVSGILILGSFSGISNVPINNKKTDIISFFDDTASEYIHIERITSNSKTIGKKGTYVDVNGLRVGEYNSTTLKRFEKLYSWNYINSVTKIDIKMMDMTYWTLKAGITRKWNSYNIFDFSLQSQIITIWDDTMGRDFSEDWNKQSENLNTLYKWKTLGKTGMRGYNWASSSFSKLAPARYYINLTNDASKKTLTLDFVMDHNLVTHAGKRFGQFADLDFFLEVYD